MTDNQTDIKIQEIKPQEKKEEQKIEEPKKKKKEKKKKSNALKQNNPPDIPVSKLYPSKDWPVGEILDYAQDFNLCRTGNTEKKNLEKVFAKDYSDARKGAEVHRQVRHYMQNWIKPGMKMIDIVEELESRVRLLTESNGLKSGIAFPTGCSLNHCAAHWTPNPGDKTVLQKGDVMKIDFGVHFNGRIIDSAFTMCWEDQFNPLLEASKAATYAGIKEAGIDVRLGDVGATIQEVMESYQVEIEKKVYDVKVVKNLCGHNIEPYLIHGGKSVPCVASDDPTKMEENEFYAIETFASTGKGSIRDDVDCSHYKPVPNAPNIHLRHAGARKLNAVIQKEFSTLAFCRRYLDRIGEDSVIALRHLVDNGLIEDCPPLVDIKGCYTSQFEHTIYCTSWEKYFRYKFLYYFDHRFLMLTESYEKNFSLHFENVEYEVFKKNENKKYICVKLSQKQIVLELVSYLIPEYNKLNINNKKVSDKKLANIAYKWLNNTNGPKTKHIAIFSHAIWTMLHYGYDNIDVKLHYLK
eukprot:gene4497-7877_t